MALMKRILFTVGIVSSFFIQTQGADKYTDENRPYEFGFNIEGEQHRHEKKGIFFRCPMNCHYNIT